MYEYICFTKQGKWKCNSRVSLKRMSAKPVRGGEAIKTDRKFYADNDIDAMRTALYYCWRDGEDFIKVEFRKGCENYTLSIFHIDNNNHVIDLSLS